MDTVSVLFVCHGNICRSPMAQCVMQDLVGKRGMAAGFVIDSAATTNEELGNPPYPPVRRLLAEKGVALVAHRARKIHANEATAWDYIVCMDEENLRHLQRILGAGNMDAVSTLLSHAGQDREVADPWYTGDFEATYRDVCTGCHALLQRIVRDNPWLERL